MFLQVRGFTHASNPLKEAPLHLPVDFDHNRWVAVEHVDNMIPSAVESYHGPHPASEEDRLGGQVAHYSQGLFAELDIVLLVWTIMTRTRKYVNM